MDAPQPAPTWPHAQLLIVDARLPDAHYPRRSVWNITGWWFGTMFFFKYFPYYMGIILPTDEFIFFKMIKTTNQISFKTRTICHETWEHINADFADYLQS
jgi:hypothetical protein